MPVNISDFFDNSANTVISLDLCDKLIRQSSNVSVNGNPNVGHADQHILGDDGFGHLNFEYRTREAHSVFATHMDAVTGLYSYLATPAGRFALVQLKRRQTTRATGFSVAPPGATMRVNMAALPFMPVSFDYGMANIRVAIDIELTTGRLHIQTLFPVKDLDSVLQAANAPGGGTATHVTDVSSGTHYWNNNVKLGSITRDVTLAQFARAVRM